MSDVRLRNTSVTRIRFEKLPRTGRECYECDEGEFRKDGHELICDHCHYTPDRSESVRSLTEWELHERQVDERSADDEERPRLVGGYREAYWGDGEYSYEPTEGKFTF